MVLIDTIDVFKYLSDWYTGQKISTNLSFSAPFVLTCYSPSQDVPLSFEATHYYCHLKVMSVNTYRTQWKHLLIACCFTDRVRSEPRVLFGNWTLSLRSFRDVFCRGDRDSGLFSSSESMTWFWCILDVVVKIERTWKSVPHPYK